MRRIRLSCGNYRFKVRWNTWLLRNGIIVDPKTYSFLKRLKSLPQPHKTTVIFSNT